ncbi:MAG: hypothetical protein JWM23_587 [Microbacteriaceae bacterium]|nr:hypothetical protein [Microbacteriaceae bacterium]
MSRGSGQDAAVLTVDVVCAGTIVGATGEIACEYEAEIDVHYSDGEAGWDCEVCGHHNTVEVETP